MLHQIGMNYRTDKATHVYKGYSYLSIYERHFEKIRLDVKVFVEIGILNGSSLYMWKEYFPNATIYGIDIDPSTKKFEDDRIKIFIGSQNDEEFLTKIINEIPEIDILVDDGSHITSHQIKTYQFLNKKIKKGGLYCIEDLRCSYEEFMNHHNVRNIWPGMVYNEPTDELKNYRIDFDTWIKEKVKSMDFHDKDNDILGIYHYPMIVIFEKFS